MSLTKVRITAYEDKDFQKPSQMEPFDLPINPENFSRELKVEADESQGSGTSGTGQKNKKQEPEQIKLEFIFDGTNTVMNNRMKDKPVNAQIEEFLKVTYKYNGKIHQPNYLKLSWGPFIFDCKLTSLSINYTLFSPAGEPLRAKLSGTFTQFISDEKRAPKENATSPNLTHVRTFSSEEGLPYMAYDVYGNPRFYLQVAKANDLTSPRLVRRGAQLVFPPIEKTSENGE